MLQKALSIWLHLAGEGQHDPVDVATYTGWEFCIRRLDGQRLGYDHHHDSP